MRPDRGERREVLALEESYCAIDGDLERARNVLRDLFRLTAVRHEPQAFADRTMALLTTHCAPSRHWLRFWLSARVTSASSCLGSSYYGPVRAAGLLR
jgi:hypothetical protein